VGKVSKKGKYRSEKRGNGKGDKALGGGMVCLHLREEKKKITIGKAVSLKVKKMSFFFF